MQPTTEYDECPTTDEQRQKEALIFSRWRPTGGKGFYVMKIYEMPCAMLVNTKERLTHSQLMDGCCYRTFCTASGHYTSHDANFGVRWARIKRFVSKQCGPELRREDWINQSKRRRKESTLWQQRFWERQILDDHDYEKYMDYLHYNPVKHGYVKAMTDWPHSSFHRYVRQGVYHEDWGGKTDL